jgi:hypothetical protein
VAANAGALLLLCATDVLAAAVFLQQLAASLRSSSYGVATSISGPLLTGHNAASLHSTTLLLLLLLLL